MSHPRNWMRVESSGLYCIPADSYIDPIEPVKSAIITHGHADHARAGHGRVIATPETMSIMRTRYGDDHAAVQTELKYETAIQLGHTEFRFESAGHILGSAQAVLTHADHTIVISGDYKRRDDATCPLFKVTPCDVFVTEATFGLPVFRHPPIEDEVTKLLESLVIFPQRCHLVGVYALGKCQRVILALRALGYHEPIFVHGALLKLCNLYQQWGVHLGELKAVSEVDDLSNLRGEIVMAPPSALADRWSRKLPDVITSIASGWMQIRARSKQKSVDIPMIVSDHCDWPELIQTIKDVNAPEVWVTHGRETALVHQATKMGYKAQALSLLGYDEEENV